MTYLRVVSSISHLLWIVHSAMRVRWLRRNPGRAAAAPLEGRHPCFIRIEHALKLLTARDAEFAIGAGEMAFDGLDGHVKLLGDLAVRVSVSGQSDDAQLAR